MNEENMIAGTKEEYENNGFDLLRYTAAFSVMMLHYSGYCMILSQNLPAQASAVMSRVRHIALMFPGVVILFTMSGFLVAASFERAKTRKEFFLRRALRIYPELWICTIINLAVVCILVTQMLDRGMILWVMTQIFGIANTLACLKALPTGSINGTLWTIFTEVQLYIVLAIIYPFLQKMKEKHWMAFLSLLAAVNLVCAVCVVVLYWRFLFSKKTENASCFEKGILAVANYLSYYGIRNYADARILYRHSNECFASVYGDWMRILSAHNPPEI